MDVQAAPPTYTASSASKPVMGNPPVLGQQVPGHSGGLPSLGGLSVTKNPMAQELQSYGRGDDSMLVHMTPAEVNSLQGLAMAHGGSLTINPHTGLPEAGWLGKLLPTLLGGIASALIPGAAPWMIGLAGAAGGTAATGNLGKGLMMGLQAFGGASLAGGLGIGQAGKAAQAAAGGAGASGAGAKTAEAIMKSGDMTGLFGQGANVAGKAPGLFDKFGAFAKSGMPGFIAKQAPLMAGAGLLSAASDASQPKMATYKPEEPSLKYTPMAPLQRKVRFQTPEQMEASGGAEYQYYTPVNPEPVPLSQVQQTQPVEGFADGGDVTAAPDFNALVAAYNASNPGAITASMKYPVSAPPATEQKYDFKRTPTAPAAATPTTGGVGGIDLSNLNLGNLDFSNLIIPATPTASARADAGGNRLEDFSNIGDVSTPYTPPSFGQPTYTYTPPQMLDINAGVQSVPAMQPTYMEPAYEAPVFAPTESLGMYPDVNSSGGNQFGRAEYVNEFARGGGVNMRDGAFVVDARTVSELGNGSSNAGMEMLSRMGGQPVRGPGDGVSDSVPAKIGGKQQARVARDEVIFQPDAVRRIGGGSEKRGTQKLYALMDKAHKARKKAKRGQDTGVRKGLA